MERTINPTEALQLYGKLADTCYLQSSDTLHGLLLQDKIRLSDIPFPLRANSVYI
ncbi:MAG: hypothetical protein FWE34_07165 [Defluviitaleaceae bacterium]|nr:hypothetical protein [Defluviitaleaceae bacterium]